VDFAAADLEIDALQGVDAGKALVDAPQDEQRRFRHPRSPS
jgi:hypothetical protein